jgi:hypothetical protein
VGAFEGLADGVEYIKKLKQRLDDLTVAVTPEALHYAGDVTDPVAPAFTNSWVNYDADRPAGFYRHGGRVYLTGIIKSGVMNATALTLPTGYRPSAVSGLIFPAVSNGALGVITVTSAGFVVPNIGSNVYFCLDGVDFRHV